MPIKISTRSSGSRAVSSIQLTATILMLGALAGPAHAEGTPAGTVIENTAQVEYDLSGSRISVNSNQVDITVIERIDISVIAQTPQLLVSAGETGRGLLFTVTNTGNGTQTFNLLADSNLPGDDFDPVLAVPAIYFDTDGSGDLSIGDVAYDPGVNDPELDADESVALLLVNDMPGTVVDGNRGLSQLTVVSSAGTGSPGDILPGQGVGGADAVVGSSGGSVDLTGEYLVADVQLDVVKSVVVADPFGGDQPVPGAILTYTVTVEAVSAGVATNVVFTDPIPANTSYEPAGILLNGTSLSDAADGDVGEYDGTANEVVVRLGDLTALDGAQTITFNVIID